MRSTIAKLILIVGIFLLFAACPWQINPGNWGHFWRFLCAFCMLVVIFQDSAD